MSEKKEKKHIISSGMELIRGGIETSTERIVPIRRCICSKDGWVHGFFSDNGCACGCFDVDSKGNHGANTERADT